MTRRLPPVPYEDWDPGAMSVQGGKLPRSNVLGLLAHHPALAKRFLHFNDHLLIACSLPDRDKELAILRVAWVRRCKYEWASHVRLGRKAGVTEEDIAGVRTGAPTLINRAADELLGGRPLSDGIYAELAERYDERQLLDFVFTVGTYAMLALVFETFEVELDPGITDENFDSV
ncbi:carboxymuconolactone decarboxylase family protein [Actinomadura rugatobispora]|uniref:Carboxymuconolactone decarboxylase family protein n=1 Tax=Actinomadura rugatobispora TaxID=1994 RepID=A0ABW1AF54_9ACTN|nr:carboxymuconolactone decarboxylase family protein [Actinomadura rugatobispora]